MSVATFGPPSLQAQLAELKRERGMRERVYPHLVASRKLTETQAAHQNRGLDGAIATLSRLVSAELRGEPGRKELVETLRALTDYARAMAHGEPPVPLDMLDKPLRDAIAILEKVKA